MTLALCTIENEHWPFITRIQEQAYSDELLESLEALQSKARVNGQQCRIVQDIEQQRCLGYLLAHSYPLGEIPAWNQDLLSVSSSQIGDKGDLNKNLFIHDFALDKSLHGQGVGAGLISSYLVEIKALGYRTVSLIAVQGSVGFWSRLGFSEKPTAKCLKSYGENAFFLSQIL